MKAIKDYINERFISNNTKIVYNYFPKNNLELRKLVSNLIDERGDNCDLNDIDVSKIKDMSNVFERQKSLQRIDISKWNVSNVENMDYMFFGCWNINMDLSSWDVSKVKSMESMFYNCEKFLGQGLDKWDVSKVTNMNSMFQACRKFNNDISRWNVSKVKDMSNMFSGCTIFNYDLSKWNVSKEIDMRYMFNYCKSLETNNLIPRWYVV